MSTKKIRRTWQCLAFSLPLMLVGMPAHAATDAWPERPVRVIVPFPAGGINDTVARIALNHLGTTMNTGIVVENRPGAGGTIGTLAAVQSPADGYTFLLGAASTIAVAPQLYRDAAYKPETDLTAIGGIASVASVAVAAADAPWKSLDDLIRHDKEKPATLHYGSAGAGTSHHVQTELLKLKTGAKWIHVPYRGGAPAMTDLIGKQIELMLEPLPTALSHIQSGRVVALGVTSAQRSPTLPDVPTLQELGIQDYEATTWFGLFAPKGLAQDIADKMSAALKKTLQSDALKQDFALRGIDVYTGDRQAFEQFVRAETRLWGDVIRDAGITVE